MTVIENATIVTMDEQRRVWAPGEISIEAGRIRYVGPPRPSRRQEPAERIDARGKLVIPGLIDAHNHPFNYLVGGHGDDLEVSDLLHRVFYPYERFVSEQEAYVGALATYAEMIRSGVTCFNDAGGYMPDAIARAAVDAGIRGIITRSTRDRFPSDRNAGVSDTTDQAIARATETVERWNGAADGRLRAWFGIRMAISASDGLVREIGRLARAKGVGVHTHAATTPFEAEASISLFGKSTLTRYRDLELLGPNVCAVHMGYFGDEDLDPFVRSGASVVHCPVASMTGAWGIIRNHRIPQLMEKGVTVAIGSDTNFGSGTLDMFRQMFVCATVHRDAHENPSLIGAAKALEMATIEGAKALLWNDEIGSLEHGKKADLAMIDQSRVEWHYPGRDVSRSIVYSGSRADVTDVMIDGRWVMQDRRLLTVDEADLRGRVSAAGESWFRKSRAALPAAR